jgi:hypothetical protein
MSGDERRCFLAEAKHLEPFAAYQRAIVALADACVATNKALEQLSAARDALIDAWQHQHEGAEQ